LPAHFTVESTGSLAAARHVEPIRTGRADVPQIEHLFYREQVVPRAEHVWVTDVRGGPEAALLLGWQQRQDGGWEGWCVVAYLGSTGHGDRTYVRQSWVRAESIKRREQ